MNNKSSVWFTLNSIINYISGIGYAFTLILLPLGIYCFICAKRNTEFAKLSDAQLPAVKEQVKNWAIFSSIVNFPIGLISIIPLFKIDDNNGIKITTVDDENNGNEAEEKPVTEIAKIEIDEKIEKLTNFKNEGIISEEEYNKAVEELKSKKN